MNTRRWIATAMAACAAATIVTIGSVAPPAGAVAPSAPLIALTATNTLVRFDAANPGAASAPIAITGLQAGETIVGIDVRPTTGEVFAVGVAATTGRVHRIDPATGAATQVGTAPFSTTLPAGASWSVDFNPTVDRIRFTQSGPAGVNLRLNPLNGALAATDTATSGGSVIGAAYDRSVPGATGTTLYAIDDSADALATIGGVNSVPSPNGGAVTPVGPLGVVLDPASTIGFDISPSPAALGNAYAALRVGGAYQLYTVDLATGAATAQGAIAPAITTIIDLAVSSAAPATLLALTATNTLVRFDAASPGTVSTPVAITGLQAGETIVGIDVRPATGELIGVGIAGTSGRIYAINAGSGAATQIGSSPFSTTLPTGATWSVDFNPTVDRIRFTQSGTGGLNLRLNPVNGALAATDTPVSGGSVIGAAYDRSVSGSTATTLYAINDTTDALATIGGVNSTPSPNGGVVTAVGPLGVTIDLATTVGLDIAPSPSALGNAYAALRVGGAYRVHTVNLATGVATDHGVIAVGGAAITDLAVVTAPPAPVVALTATNTLVRFDAAAPGGASAPVAITGLQTGETIVGIDTRPATGQLFGVGVTGSTGRIYVINPTTGAATVVGAAPFSTTLPTPATWSVDFNPTVDRIRFTQSGVGGVNLRLNPNDGALAGTDTPINGGSVIGAAYDRSVAGATATTLYAIDDNTDSLAIVGGVNGSPSPNLGAVTPVGPLGVTIDAASTVGFDIAPSVNQFGTAYAALRVGNVYRVYTVDLASGSATARGLIALGGASITDIAVLSQFPAAASQFTPLTPTRILDTRDGTGAPAAKPGPGATVELQVTGALVPANASAVVLNVVGTEATADGFITLFPTGEARPFAANGNLVTGQTRGNMVTVKIGAGGKVSIFTQSGTHLVADVFGYYAPPTSTAGRFNALTPARLIDTRLTTKVAPGGTVDVQVTGNGGVPAAGVTSVVVNISATEATAAGFITGYAAGAPRPTTANLNIERVDQTIGNLAILPVGAGGAITLFSQSGTHLVVDVFGWFSDTTGKGGAAGLYVPVTPVRQLDTREAPATKIQPDSSVDLTIAGATGVPASGVSSAVVNLTAVEVTAPGFVTVFPAGIPRPLISSVYGDLVGQIIPSLAYATLPASGRVTIYSNKGTHVVVDLAGYYLS